MLDMGQEIPYEDLAHKMIRLRGHSHLLREDLAAHILVRVTCRCEVVVIGQQDPLGDELEDVDGAHIVRREGRLQHRRPGERPYEGHEHVRRGQASRQRAHRRLPIPGVEAQADERPGVQKQPTCRVGGVRQRRIAARRGGGFRIDARGALLFLPGAGELDVHEVPQIHPRSLPDPAGPPAGQARAQW